MKTKPPKPFILILFCMLFFSILDAKKCPGCIVTNTQDTIYGDVRIRSIDYYKGGIVINGINLDPFYERLEFKAQNSNSYNYYYPADISAFSFCHQSDSFQFHSFTLHPKSIFPNERSKQCYLALILKGEFSLYKTVNRELINDNSPSSYLTDWKNTYYEYYIYSEDLGLNKLTKTEHYKNVKELLIFYGLEIEFIQKLPEKVDFKNIVEILIEYNNWKIKDLRSI